jgi:DNA invertase Pin-like site-specific DNA recombinase
MMKSTGKRVAIYARVSTDSQSTDNQLRELRRVARVNGWKISAEFTDKGVSGSKGREKRPQFDQLLKAAVRREFDVIAAWSVDRLGRSLQDLVGFLSEIHAKGIDLYLHQQGIDTTTPAGKALFQMCGVFAEFERAMIVERVRSGLARAKAQGTKSGRAIGRPRVNLQIEHRIRVARKEGLGILRIARKIGCGVSTVQRVIAGMAQVRD